MSKKITLPTFSAALLAGGESSRMGVDKATLDFAGRPLWQHQLATLHATKPSEVFIAGRADGPYASSDCEVIFDETPGGGPLVGLQTALRRARHDWLLVLAIDLPDVPADFLRGLVAEAAAAGHGLVPAREEWLQPVAAVYPRRALALVERCLAGENHALRRFFRLARKEGLADVRLVTAEEHAFFRNLNTPDDLAGR
jgi:molybdopterin-guanine dinucleotide biosynthesis protein A